MNLDFHITFSLIIDWMVIATTSFALLSLLNPLTTIPYYFLLHPKAKEDEVKRDGLKIGWVVFIILTISLFLWTYILEFLWLDISYFKMGGGVIIFLMALSMIKWEMSSIKINTIERNKIKNDYIDKGLILPLALPLTSWAGAIAYTIWLHSYWLINWFISVMIASLITWVVLRYSWKIKNIMGEIWMHLITRIFWLFMIWIWLQIIGEAIKITFLK